MPAHIIENGISNAMNYFELPRIKDEVVVSGISGRLPESGNIGEFRDNLMNKKDMVNDAETRWPKGLYGLPERSGKLKDLTKFDANFFGVNPKQANVMDPQLRLLLEASYEAILDSGINPQSIRGTKTGVFIGGSASEAHEAWGLEAEKVIGYSMTGCTRSMFANRISYALDLKGPSYCVDTACSSSLLAFENALAAIRTGQCDAALVGGVSICVKPTIALQFQKLSMLSPTGTCKSFDSEGNGYCRSEAVVAVFLQKAKDARRVYCYAIHAKSNSDGFKNDGITFPSGNMQKKLIEEVYYEAQVDPLSVSYIEAHGTGTQAGDPQECNALDAFFCANRNLPLLIGSVKSNMGHPEPASGLAALAKIIISMEEGIIPPNLYYNKPNPNIPGLVEGRLKVVTELTPWQGGYMALNNFGFGGSNVHAIFHPNYNINKHQDFNISIPKLFVISGRTEQAVQKIMTFVSSYPNDHYLYNLLEESAKNNLSSHPYRGYQILNSDHKEIYKQTPTQRPLWYIFSGMGAQWTGMAKHMMHLNLFKNSIMRLSAILEPYGVNLLSILTSDDPTILKKTLNSFVSVAAIQIAIVDILNHVGIQPDGIIGHSVGELGCGYADGGFTAEEMILAAYWRGKCIEDANLPAGGMAAVGLSWEEAIQTCPHGIVPACHNSEDTVTVSGPHADIVEFVQKLNAQDIFAKEVNSAGVAFHSYFMKPIGPILKKALEKVVKTPKPRSHRWISSSIPEENWNSDLAKYCSAEYHANNLCSPVLFQEAIKHIPPNAVTFEIAPHCLLQAILKRSLSPDCKFLSCMKRGHENNLVYFLENVGRLYTYGFCPDITKLYPSISYPVPKGTPMISPHVLWDHSDTWDVPTHEHFDAVLVKGGSSGSSFTYEVDLNNPDEEYLAGHKIDGRILFPATGYIVLAWKALAKMCRKVYTELPITIENFNIMRATILSYKAKTLFEVNVLPNLNQFEIVENSAIVASGTICANLNENIEIKEVTSQSLPLEGHVKLLPSDIYKELSLRGYEYSGEFRGIKEIDTSASFSKLSWKDNWITFLDTMLQSEIMAAPNRNLNLPNRIKMIKIDPTQHFSRVDMTNSDVNTFYNKTVSKIISGGVEIFGLHTTAISKKMSQHEPILEKFSYLPYYKENILPKEKYNSFTNYKIECEKLICDGIKLFLSSPDSLPNRDTFSRLLEYIPKNVKIGALMKEDSAGVLKYFQALFNLPLTQHLHQSVLRLYESHQDEIFKDDLMSLLLDKNVLKPLLDIVIENCGSKIKMLEFNADSNPLISNIFTLMNKHPQTKLEYTMSLKSDDNVEEILSQLFIESDLFQNNVKSFHYNVITNEKSIIPNNDIPQLGNNAYDLVLLNKKLHKCLNLRPTLELIHNTLKPGGFCLIHECTNNFAVPFTIDSLVEKIEFPNKDENFPERNLNLYFNYRSWIDIFTKTGFTVACIRSDGLMSSLYLLRKPFTEYLASDNAAQTTEVVANHKTIEIYDLADFTWVETLKEELASNFGPNDRLWLVSKFKMSGLVGFINCLRQENNGNVVRLVYDASYLSHEGNPMPVSLPFDRKVGEWENLVCKDLVMNVWDGFKWGSYRHSLVNTQDFKFLSEYAYINCLKKGDLSSLSWLSSELRPNNVTDGYELCSVTYAALNFRDIMLATGKLPPDAIPGNFSPNDCLLGMEFSGYNSKREKIMGLVPAKGLATFVEVTPSFTWKLPSSWSLSDAATIPVVYATAYYALIVRGRLRENETVLIHSGSGGVGQAAISIALSLNCTVYTTVGSLMKRHYLKKRFPQLTDDNFANSRDLSFEDHVCKMTGGRGVDVVLNSLSEDKLQASVRLLAPHGRFLEIGKYDLSNDSPLGMAVFLRNVSFHGILLDALFEGGNNDWVQVHKMVSQGIESGVVRPLKTTIYAMDKAEDAFRFMAQGKHIGKVLIQLRNEKEGAITTPIKVFPHIRFNPTGVYMITGGLGGFGLELTDWMVERGAKNIILLSRSGVKNGYQASRLKHWQRCGISVKTSSRDISRLSDVEALMGDIKPLGQLDGIFHLAAVLRDAFLENQTIESFKDVAASKIVGTHNLDTVSRQFYPRMSYFVVFSSISCGRGNAGQTNYGLANSTMERICEDRVRQGFTALAIQWGAIGDVGLIMDTMKGNETVVGGTLPQRIDSCFNVLEVFMSSPYSVVSSYVLAEKGVPISHTQSKINVIDAIAHILGIKDTSSINQDTTLADLGLDSLMGVEIKQTLEREYEIVLSTKEIRQLNFNKIKNLTGSQVDLNIDMTKVASQPLSEVLSPVIGLELIQRRYNVNELVPKETVIFYNSEKKTKPIFMIHPIEGSLIALHNIINLVNNPVYGFQCTAQVPQNTVGEMAKYYVEKMLEIQPQGPYQICAYSFGATIAFEMALQLQDRGIEIEPLIFLDGSHSFVASHTQYHLTKLTPGSDLEKYAEVMVAFVLLFVGSDYIKLKKKFSALGSIDEIINAAVDRVMQTNLFPDRRELEMCARFYYQKLMICDMYVPSSSYKGNITLIRVKEAEEMLGKDYNLSNVCLGKIDIKYVEGDHETFIIGDNAFKVIDYMNQVLYSQTTTSSHFY